MTPKQISVKCTNTWTALESVAAAVEEGITQQEEEDAD